MLKSLNEVEGRYVSPDKGKNKNNLLDFILSVVIIEKASIIKADIDG